MEPLLKKFDTHLNNICKGVNIEYWITDNPVTYGYGVMLKKGNEQIKFVIQRNELLNLQSSSVNNLVIDAIYTLFDKLGDVDKLEDDFKKFLFIIAKNRCATLRKEPKIDGYIFYYKGKKYVVNFRLKEVCKLTDEIIKKIKGDNKMNKIKKINEINEILNDMCEKTGIKYLFNNYPDEHYEIIFEKTNQHQTLIINKIELSNLPNSTIRSFIENSIYRLLDDLGEVDKMTDDFRKFLFYIMKNRAVMLGLNIDGDIAVYNDHRYYINFIDKEVEEITDEKVKKMDDEWKDIRYKMKQKQIQFELGKYYKHTTGTKIYICGLGETYYHGRCFIGENERGELSPVGNGKENAINYSEITKDDFVNNKDVNPALNYKEMNKNE